MSDRREFLMKAVGAAAASMMLGSPIGKFLSTGVDAIGRNVSQHSLGTWKLFNIAGQTVFSIYGKDGGITSRMMSWLITQHNGKSYATPIEFTYAECAAGTDTQEGMEQFAMTKFALAMREGKFKEVNLDGGELPLPEHLDA